MPGLMALIGGGAEPLDRAGSGTTLKSRVNPSILGFDEAEFKVILVEQFLDGSKTYVGILHSGAPVALSARTGQRELLLRKPPRLDGTHTNSTERDAKDMAFRYQAAKKKLSRVVSIMAIAAILVCASAVSAIIGVLSTETFVLGLESGFVVTACAVLIVGALLVMHRSINRLSVL